MRLVLSALTACAVLAAAGCVIRTEHTIDARIQVDVRYVEEQAEDVLDFIEGKSDELSIETPPTSRVEPSFFDDVLEVLTPIQTAHAQELKSDSPEIRRLAEKLRARNSEIEALKKSGCMGEDNRGYVDILPCDALEEDNAAKNEAQRLKTEENEDRKAMYNEFVRLNAESNFTVAQIERIFARKRLERASSGEWFQLPAAGSDFDNFKNSATGRKLGDKASPGAWVQIP